MKWRTIARIALSLFGIALVASIVVPILSRVREPSGHYSCQSNLKQIGLGLVQYVQDYDGKYPLLSVNAVATSLAPYKTPYGWADALQPYVRNIHILKCPAISKDHYDTADGVTTNFTDYYLNTNLNGINEKRLTAPYASILLGDGNGGGDLTDARYNRNSLPLAWLHDKNMPTFRHLDGANYAFVDGHVKWLTSDKITAALRPHRDYATFALEWRAKQSAE